MTVAANLASVRDRIAHTGRDPNQITIVAVTKGFGPAECQEALDAGLTILGENRVQEALTKMASVRGATWHLIGHLQTNKVKLASGRFELIHTVDSPHLADALARASPEQQVLVVCQHHADRHDVLQGSSARTRNPPSGRFAAAQSPPSAAARSAIPVIPAPGAPPPAGAPAPSSTTSTSSRSPLHATRTAALAPGPACRATLVSDSWTIR